MADSAEQPAFFRRESSPLQRIGEVRREHGVSRRQLQARLKKLGCDLPPAAVKELDRPECDTGLEILWMVSTALGVPIEELLAANEDDLKLPLDKMRRLLAMANDIAENAETATRRMAENLIAGLLEVDSRLARWQARRTPAPQLRPPADQQWFDGDEGEDEQDEEDEE